jgi:hypothetical protein
MQAALDVHDTLLNPLSFVPAGFGLGCIDQRFPFQRSTNVAHWSALTL